MYLKHILFLFLLSFTLTVRSVEADYCESKAKVIRTLIGRGLTENEKNKFCSQTGNLVAFWDSVINAPSFIDHNYPILRFDYLQGASDAELHEALIDFEQIRLFQSFDSRVFGEREFKKLHKIYDIPKDYKAGIITLEEVQIRLLNNYLYDQINMGIDNFINTAFAYLIGRTPTRFEFKSSYRICENREEMLFFHKGSSKEDLLAILTSNDNYYEYQTKFWFEKIYFKEPDQKTINDILKTTINEFNKLNLKNILLIILSKY